MTSEHIKAISEADYSKNVAHICDRVFADPLGDGPFTTGMANRALVYPTTLLFSAELMNAIAKAGRVLGDSAAYLTQLPTPIADAAPALDASHRHWWIPLAGVSEYQVLHTARVPIETGLFSESGKWGAATMLDDITVLGGIDGFADLVLEELRQTKDDLVEGFLSDFFRRNSKSNVYFDRLTLLLSHLFGEGECARYLHGYM